MLSRNFVLYCAAVVVTAGATSAAAAGELYRWVDERGVVNYSNEPPADRRTVKDLRLVEDRTSVYTPDKPLADAMRERARKQRTAPPAASLPREPQTDARRQAQEPALPPFAYDPCLTGSDVDCYTIYDGSPVFAGRRRPPRLVQPELPLGATAGNVTGPNGYIAGQSGSAPQAAPPRRTRAPGGRFLTKEPEPDRAGRRLR